MQSTPTRKLQESVAREYWPTLKRFFRSMAPEPDCYDLVQQTLTELVGCDLAGVKQMKPYVMRIAHRVLAKYFDKQQASAVHFDSAVHSVMHAPTSLSVRLDKRNRILNALRSLPLAHQEAVELSLCEDLGAAEIAEVMERNVASVYRYIADGKARLRGLLAGDVEAAVAEAYRNG
jgi:RNA polymerase sigma factor (sigma-70 family)